MIMEINLHGMIPYFEKTLCSVAREIRCTSFFLFKKLFKVDIYTVLLIPLMLLLLLLLSVIAFGIS